MAMSKELHCSDIGMKDCNYVARGNTEQDVIKQAASHAAKRHGLTTMDTELQKKVAAAIRTTT
jgi:predicted small metal-binding protein